MLNDAYFLCYIHFQDNWKIRLNPFQAGVESAANNQFFSGFFFSNVSKIQIFIAIFRFSVKMYSNEFKQT